MNLNTEPLELQMRPEDMATLEAAGGAEFVAREIIAAVVAHMRANGSDFAGAMAAVKAALGESQ